MTNEYWLLDGGALTAEEREVLRALRTAQPLYRFMKDSRAEDMGPWLAPSGAGEVEEMSRQVRFDDARRWAANLLRSAASLEELALHFASLIHLWTADGQRFFLRFADGRSMRTIWAILGERQRLSAMGPLQSWCTTARDGRDAHLFKAVAGNASHEPIASFRLHLNDAQLVALLELSWPDQLLAAVLDDSPDLAQDRCVATLYDLAEKTCEWLRLNREDSFVRQKESLAYVLRHNSLEWTPPPVSA